MKLAYRGKLINLLTKRIKLPSGHTSDFEIIIHPGAVLIIPFLSKEKVIILRQFRPVINSYLYELPAGTLKTAESPLLCCQRELIEETGFSAKKLKRLGEIYPVPGYSTEKIRIYKAEGLKPERICTEKDEVISVKIVSKTQIKKLFMAGKITDAKTICALAMCRWLY